MTDVARLITFRVSHYCEKVRWALNRSGLPYVEESHLPLLHRLKTMPLLFPLTCRLVEQVYKVDRKSAFCSCSPRLQPAGTWSLELEC